MYYTVSGLKFNETHTVPTRGIPNRSARILRFSSSGSAVELLGVEVRGTPNRSARRLHFSTSESAVKVAGLATSSFVLASGGAEGVIDVVVTGVSCGISAGSELSCC